MNERQQAEALIEQVSEAIWETYRDADRDGPNPCVEAAENALAVAAPALLAEGYERGKRDASKGIEARFKADEFQIPLQSMMYRLSPTEVAEYVVAEVAAVVAALNATQQEGEPWDADECRCVSGMHTCGKPNTATQQEASDD